MVSIPEISRHITAPSLKIAALSLIIFIAFFLRFWNLSENVMFQGDQGRDALVVARIFREQDLVFIGPVMSVGNMYLGPLYYYFMLPFLYLTYPSPLGPAYAVAGLGVLTVWLIYHWGRKLIGESAAMLASLLYALSSAYVITTRFSWNPNPEPLLGICMMYCIYQARQKRFWYWTGAFASFAVLIQLHYVSLLSGAALGIFWLIQLKQILQLNAKQRFAQLKQIGIATAAGLMIILLTLLPLLAFDYTHNWLNAKAFWSLTTDGDNFAQNTSRPPLLKLAKIVNETHGRSMHLFFEMTVGKHRTLNTAMVALLALGLVKILWMKQKQRSNSWADLDPVIPMVFCLVGILGLSVYQHSVFDHYLGFLYPAATLCVALVLTHLYRSNLVGKMLVIGYLGLFVSHNWLRYPLTAGSNRLQDLEFISRSIAARVEPGEKYNIVLLSETGDIDAMKYRYFLETTATPPVRTEQRGEVSKLFIINEDKKLARVVESPVYEIVVFPDKNPTEVYEIIGGPEITVLEKSSKDE